MVSNARICGFNHDRAMDYGPEMFDGCGLLGVGLFVAALLLACSTNCRKLGAILKYDRLIFSLSYTFLRTNSPAVCTLYSSGPSQRRLQFGKSSPTRPQNSGTCIQATLEYLNACDHHTSAHHQCIMYLVGYVNPIEPHGFTFITYRLTIL